MSLVSANKTETNTYSVELSIAAADFKAAVQKAYLKQRKSIQIPGFRKGKAPQMMIEKLYGKEVFYEDALDIVLPEEISAAYKEANITPVDQPRDFDVKSMSVEEGVSLTFNVTVKPEITLKQYKGIEAEKEECSVSADEVKHEIEHMLEGGARIIDVDDRAAKKGDITVIDFEGFVDGVAFDGGKAEKYNLTLGDGQFIPGFEDQIIGHKIGEEFDVNVKFPEDYAPELASKDAVFKIKLHEIKVKELPELDDEFAKDKDYDTVADLKKGVKADLLERKQHSAQHAFEDAVINALCENVEGEIPEVMYDNKAEENVENFANRVQQQGIDLDTYLMYMGMDKEAFKATMRERAVNDVKFDLAIEKVMESENFEITAEQINAEIEKMAEQYNITADEIKKFIAEDMIAADLKKQAAVQFVIDNAVAKTEAKAKKTTAKAKKDAEPKAEAAEEKKPAKPKTTKKKAEPKEEAAE